MKRCPSCQQTYPDDAPDYCSNDGMRLVDEEAAGYDPERTIMSSGLRGGDLLELDASPAPTPSTPPTPPSSLPPPPQYQSTAAQPPADIKPPTEWQPPHEQAPQSWQTPGGQAAQPGWPSPQQQQQQPPAQNWGGVPSEGQPQQPAYSPYGSSQPAANAPYAAPYAPPVPGGRSRALSIAALVTGACAVTIMTMLVARNLNFTLASLLSLAILGLGLGVASLVLSLQKPARFGGIPLAIAGLAMGTAALVYYFTR
jgi:hypothetical protein